MDLKKDEISEEKRSNSFMLFYVVISIVYFIYIFKTLPTRYSVRELDFANISNTKILVSFALLMCCSADVIVEKIDKVLSYSRISYAFRKMILSILFISIYSFTYSFGQEPELFLLLLPLWLILFANDARPFHYSERYGNSKSSYEPLQFSIYAGTLLVFQIGLAVVFLTNMTSSILFTYLFVMGILITLGIDALLQWGGKFYKCRLHNNPMRKKLGKAMVILYILGFINYKFQLLNLSPYLYLQVILMAWFTLLYSDLKSYQKSKVAENEKIQLSS